MKVQIITPSKTKIYENIESISPIGNDYPLFHLYRNEESNEENTITFTKDQITQILITP